MSSQLNNKPSFLKDVVFVVILAVLIGGINEYLQRYNYDVWAIADQYDKEHGLGKYKSNQPSIDTESQNNTDESTQTESTYVPKTGVVYVHGLGDYTQSELSIVKSSVEKFYGLPCVIGEDITKLSDFYYVGSNLMAYRVLSIKNDDGNRHVFVTNEPLCPSEDDLQLISGNARVNSKTCVVSSYQMKQNGRDVQSALSHTVKHEMGHNFGLGHCGNQNCLMKSHGLDTHEFCDECKRKINN